MIERYSSKIGFVNPAALTFDDCESVRASLELLYHTICEFIDLDEHPEVDKALLVTLIGTKCLTPKTNLEGGTLSGLLE